MTICPAFIFFVKCVTVKRHFNRVSCSTMKNIEYKCNIVSKIRNQINVFICTEVI